MASVPPATTVRAFGALRVIGGGVETELRRRRERNVLATLLAASGRPVSADRLVMEAWGDEAPAKALTSLQVVISRLRVLLEPGRSPRSPARLLVSTASGYALALPTEAVDLTVFESLVGQAEAATDPVDRLRASDRACAMWSAEPFFGCDTDSVRRAAERLVELRLVALEIRAQALLDLDEPSRAAVGLGPLLADNPYRERLWALQALAQYRCARQTDALETLRTLRARLAGELGIDPSPQIVRLEHALLNQDESLLQGALAANRPAVPSRVAVSAPASATQAKPRTIGRETALATIRDLVDGLARSGRGGFLLISGEPGIGKSRLVEDLAMLAGVRRAQVLVGRCHADFAPALWPWLPVLRQLIEQAPDPQDDAPLHPVLAQVPHEAEPGGGSILRLFDAVTRLLDRAAADRPLVVILEDLHWADVTSLRLLAHVVAAGLGGHVLLVGTRRTSDAPTSDALVTAMAELARAGATRIRLEGLAPDAVSALLTEVLSDHDPRLDAVVADATAGNPFFVLEYARLLQGVHDPLHAAPAGLPVPDGVRDVLRQRLARLPEDARRLLTIAAVVGRTIDPDLLAGLAGMSIDAVLDLLDLTLASGLLADQAQGFAFAHALTRETLAAELSAARRMRLHDQISRALHDRYADTPDEAAHIAHHAFLAAPLGPAYAQRAVTALARAARVAEARQAYDEALALWRQAETAATGPDAAAQRVEALGGSAYALLRLARSTQARACVVEAVRLARDVRRFDLVAAVVAVPNRAGVWTWREHGVKDEPFIAALREALAHVDDVGRARLLAALQVEHYFAWERDRAAEAGEEALLIARRTGDEELLREVLLVTSVVATFGPHNAPARLARIEELRRHPLRGELATFAEFLYARTLYECARVADADAAAARCAAAARDLRHTGVGIPLAWWFFARAQDREDARAAELARAELERHQRGGVAAGAELDLLYRLRMAAPAVAIDPELIDGARHLPAGMRALVAHAVLDTGDAATALRLLGAPSPPGASDYSVLAGHCLRVAVLATAGEHAELPEALRRIEPYSGDVVTYGTVEHLGVVDYFLAVGYAALGERERARKYCAAALDLLGRLDTRTWRRRAGQLAAGLAEAAGEQEQAAGNSPISAG